jgi:hypothetical protein
MEFGRAASQRPFLFDLDTVRREIDQPEANELFEDQNQNLDDYTCAGSLGPLLCFVGKGLCRLVALLVA